jgi:hypothetical protein
MVADGTSRWPCSVFFAAPGRGQRGPLDAGPLLRVKRTSIIRGLLSVVDPRRRVVVGERRRDLESASPLRLRLNQQLTVPLRAPKARFSVA